MNGNSVRSTSSAGGLGSGHGLQYTIITPARNEAAFIGLLLESMISQTVPPVRWVIVSDGSTDGTDDIVREYAKEFEWIELLRMPERRERHFTGKVHAFNAGYARVRDLQYDIIGNVDADISFEPDLFEFLLARFAEDPSLGVAGTEYIENSFSGYNYNFVNIEDVTGHCQIFRRQCFEEIGGYVPIRDGGIDSVAVITARMKGWKTRTFLEKTCVHHRQVGTAQGSSLVSFYKAGKKDYFGGGHLLWQLFRSIYHMNKKPYVLAGLSIFAGYAWPFLKGAERAVSTDLVEFRGKEQMKRLNNQFRRILGLRYVG